MTSLQSSIEGSQFACEDYLYICFAIELSMATLGEVAVIQTSNLSDQPLNN